MADSREMQLVLTLQDKISKDLDKVQGKLKGLEPTFKKMASVGTVAFLGLSVAIGKVLNTAGELEQQTIAFETMLGSTEKAFDMLKQLSDFATKTPFEIQGIRQTAKMLLAMGTGEEKLIETLKMLGDVSAGLSVPLERIALNYGQIRTQGKLTGRELRDFAVQGVPLVDELAKSFGVTKEEIAEMVSAGEIGFPAVEQAFKNMSGEGGRFADLMDKQSKSMKGQWSNLKDQITLVSEKIGMTLIPIATTLLEKVMPIVERLGLWIEKNPKLASGILLVSTAIAGIIALIGILGLIMPSIIAGFGFLATAIGGVATALTFLAANPVGIVIGIIVGAIALLIFFIKDIIKNIDAVAIVWGWFWDWASNKVKSIIDTIVGAFKYLEFYLIITFLQIKEKVASMINGIKDKFNSLVTFIQVVGVILGEAWTIFWQTLSDIVSNLLSYILEFIMGKWEAIKELFFSGIAIISGAWGSFWTAMTTPVKTAWEGVKEVVSASINWITDKINKVINATNNILRKVSGKFGIPDIQIPTIPALAKGGVLKAGQTALVGEEGAELFTPSVSGRVVPNNKLGGGTSVIINISGNTIAGNGGMSALAKMVGEEVMKKLRINQRLAI